MYTTSSGNLRDELNLITFSGKLVETYISIISEDGRNIASGIYTGQLTVSQMRFAMMEEHRLPFSGQPCSLRQLLRSWNKWSMIATAVIYGENVQ